MSLLTQARGLLADACAAADPGERFRLAHLAALRIAAVVLAERGSLARSRRRLVSIWPMLEKTSTEHAARARYFASGAAVRAAVEVGTPAAVSPLVADEQVRAATEFLLEVESSLGMLAA
jgi:hypothetical protein